MTLNINGTTGISGVDGSVSAPALTGTDSNTGITFPSADTIKFATGGVERMSITNSGITGIAAGITEADSWRVTTNFTGDAVPISSNWERGDSSPWEGYLGTGLTESSGVFTFPSTGWYFVIWSHYFYYNSFSDWDEMSIELSNDSGSNWTQYHNTEATAPRDGTFWHKATESMIMDITNTSTQKMRFRVDVDNNSVTTQGNTSKKQTGFDIFRLGDT